MLSVTLNQSVKVVARSRDPSVAPAEQTKEASPPVAVGGKIGIRWIVFVAASVYKRRGFLAVFSLAGQLGLLKQQTESEPMRECLQEAAILALEAVESFLGPLTFL